MPNSTTREMRDFIYTGPASGVTLRLGDGSSIERMLFTGQAVALPLEHAHVQRLIAQGFLAEATSAAEAKPVVIKEAAPQSPGAYDAPPAVTPAPETRPSRRRGTSTETNS